MSINQSVGRLGDEGPESGLLIQTDDQGDVYVTVKKENRLANLMAPDRTTVRFCTMQGGGRSLKVRKALLALRDAMQEENERDPRAAWDADAPAVGPATEIAAEDGCTCKWKAGHDNRCPAYAAYVAAMDETPAPAGTGPVEALQVLLNAPSYNAARYAAQVKEALPAIIAALTSPAAELATGAGADGEAIELPGLTRHHITELERLAEKAYRFVGINGSNWDPNVCQNAVVLMASQINLLTPNPDFNEATRSLLIRYAAYAEPRAILAMIAEIRALRAALATRGPGVTGAVIATELPADVQNYLNGLPALLETGKELEKGLEEARANSDAGLKEIAYLQYFNHTDFHYSRLLRTVQCLAAIIQPGNGPDNLPLHNPGSSFGSHYLLLKMPEYQQVPAVVGYYDFKRDEWFDHTGAQVDAPVEWWQIAWPGYPKKVIGTPHPHPGTEAAGEM